MSERYSVADKSLEELLRAVDSDLIAGKRHDAYEVLGAAVPLRVAIENERAAQAIAKWARIATFSSVASVGVAIAAVIVAAVA
jgi:hypothetical protein